MNNPNWWIIAVLVLCILGLLMWRSGIISDVETMETRRKIGNMNVRTYVINMDKDTSRYAKIVKYYKHSDLSDIPLERYSAVVGRNIDPVKWLSSDALV